MVLESLIEPFQAEKHPMKAFAFGFLYAIIGSFIALLVFRDYASLVAVFLTTLASVPLVYGIIKYEEEKDLQDLDEGTLLREHWKALKVFLDLFMGATLAYSLLFIFLPNNIVMNNLFKAQIETIISINGKVVEAYVSGTQISLFSKILSNNLRVLIFTLIFSFLYGLGAIFILIWNASVIGVAIGNFIRTNLANTATLFSLSGIAKYFQTTALGILRYAIHGIPEILAYFIAGLAGSIVSIAIIKHDLSAGKFEHIVLDASDLLLISLIILVIAAFLEVYVTPLVMLLFAGTL